MRAQTRRGLSFPNSWIVGDLETEGLSGSASTQCPGRARSLGGSGPLFLKADHLKTELLPWTLPDRPKAFVLFEFTVLGHKGNTFRECDRNQRTVKRIVVMSGQPK